MFGIIKSSWEREESYKYFLKFIQNILGLLLRNKICFSAGKLEIQITSLITTKFMLKILYYVNTLDAD